MIGVTLVALAVGFLLWRQGGTEPAPVAAVGPIADHGANRSDGALRSAALASDLRVLSSVQAVGVNEAVQDLQQSRDESTSIQAPTVGGRDAGYWHEFESSMAAEPLVGEELAAITTQALKLFAEHLLAQLDRQDKSVAAQRTLRQSDLVFDLLPEFAKLIHDGKIHVQRSDGAGQALQPVVAFSLDLDKPELFLNIHDARMNFAYRLPRSVGSEERWQAILDEWRRR